MGKNKGWNLQQSYTSLPEIFYEKVSLDPVRNPKIMLFNDALAKKLGLMDEKKDDLVNIFAGNSVPENSVFIAQSYAGHQFGHFMMLGDGRNKLIGEQVTPEKKRVDIQLKGAGKTAYSRGGDGRAALGPMLREYIISEAMHGLGIPTTRSLAVVTTGEKVYREEVLDGAVLTRVATSHIRVGTFQFAAKFGEISDLVKLADYAIERHDPSAVDTPNPYLTFLHGVIKRQAELIAKWQLVGFIHGVMNTDNMLISGETIDYGPCAFMDDYDSQKVFSSIDREGRYAYRNQPGIAAWNLARLAEAMLPLLGNGKEEALANAQEAISQFGKWYKEHWFNGMLAKLGLFYWKDGDESLIGELLALMERNHADYTNTFLVLTHGEICNFPMGRMEEFIQWKEKWKKRLDEEGKTEGEVLEQMRHNNPAIIPRNRWVEDAIAQAVEYGDYTDLEQLLDVLKDPFAHTEEQLNFSRKVFDTGTSYQTFCGT